MTREVLHVRTVRNGLHAIPVFYTRRFTPIYAATAEAETAPTVSAQPIQAEAR